jgi:AraC family transcriptional regulator, regulatory protein of adaptative response / methylated-DNA-[protein]-cysteine methyltransferase
VKGVCSILLGDDAEELRADLANSFPQSTLIPSKVAVKDDVAKVLLYIEKPSHGLHLTSTCAARRSNVASGKR